ncbi:MAG: response regulator [Planctomycetes bacterium]|nr:response regulator [Planctomycetota bacterium]
MTKRVLDVGNCAADHGALRRLIEGRFDAKVVASHTRWEALAALREGPFDLVLVNRKLDRDHSDGIDIIREMKSDAALAATPVMLITNFPDHQQSAVEAGALPGFGKASLDAPETTERLGAVLQKGEQ